MKYKTVIEVVSEADSKMEALDIAGEYLRGAISSGITMRCSTRPLGGYGKRASLALALGLFFVAGFILSSSIVDGKSGVSYHAPAFNAMQPPLKTSAAARHEKSFREEWEDEEVRQALNVIKN